MQFNKLADFGLQTPFADPWRKVFFDGCAYSRPFPNLPYMLESQIRCNLRLRYF